MAKHRRRDRKYRLTFAFVIALAACLPVVAVADTSSTVRPYIVGGTEAPIRDYPYVVYLTDRAGNQFCGGVLVSASVVATAAHCASAVAASDTLVVAGRADKRSSDGAVAQVVS